MSKPYFGQHVEVQVCPRCFHLITDGSCKCKKLQHKKGSLDHPLQQREWYANASGLWLPRLTLLVVLLWLCQTAIAGAAITNWNTGQTLSGTEAISPGPGIDLSNWNAPGHQLEFANLSFLDLSTADFSNSDLVYASFGYSNLTNANFNGAFVKGVYFAATTGLTAPQLYSTASYANHDLAGIRLHQSDLTGWQFENQNLSAAYYRDAMLTNANFAGATLRFATFYHVALTNANFTDAIVEYATFDDVTGFTEEQLYSTANYNNNYLVSLGFYGFDLTGWNFTNQNLTSASIEYSTLTNTSFAGANLFNARFFQSNLTNAIFAGAIINGTHFRSSIGFTTAQFYSTASYTNHDLAGVDLEALNLTGWNFANQNLTASTFSAAVLTNADFSGADLRGATGWSPVATTIAHNTIHPDGTVQGLTVLGTEKLAIHNYSLAITVTTSATFDPNSTLQIVFDAATWGSTISFAPGIPVARGGTLDLEVAAGVNLDTLIGRTFDLFDWTGISPTGNFLISSPYTWDLSKLYTTGEVKLLATGIPGDFNEDSIVNAADYVVWRNAVGTMYSPADYDTWRTHFSQTSVSDALANTVPEPSTYAFICMAALLVSSRYPWSSSDGRK